MCSVAYSSTLHPVFNSREEATASEKAEKDPIQREILPPECVTFHILSGRSPKFPSTQGDIETSLPRLRDKRSTRLSLFLLPSIMSVHSDTKDSRITGGDSVVEHGAQQWTEAEERRLVRKIDFRCMVGYRYCCSNSVAYFLRLLACAGHRAYFFSLVQS